MSIAAPRPRKRPLRLSRKPPPAPSATGDRERLGRVEIVREALSYLEAGAQADVIAERLAQNHGFTARMGRKYARRAREIMSARAAAEAPFARAVRIRSMLAIRRRAVAVGDLGIALAAEREIAELQGLYRHRSHVTADVTPEVAGLLAAVALNPFDQRRRLADLEAKATAPTPRPPQRKD